VGREALRRARLAAQAHGAALQKQQAQMRARLFGGGAYGIGIGVAACVVLGAALLLQSGGDEPAPLTPSAQAATLTVAPVAPREAATDQAQTYFAALRLLDEGDSEAGVRLLRRAAEGGFVLAQYRLSKHYERGEGAPQSLALALQWAERAAEAGNVLAMHDVGVFYARGELGAPDEAAAFRWFRQAAEYGIADSQYNLGVLYLQGRGIAVDPREALFWFLVAAHNDDANAIDRAVAVAATLTPREVAHLRERARAFQARTPNVDANAPQG
jgi:localization factor PodJL